MPSLQPLLFFFYIYSSLCNAFADLYMNTHVYVIHRYIRLAGDSDTGVFYIYIYIHEETNSPIKLLVNSCYLSKPAFSLWVRVSRIYFKFIILSIYVVVQKMYLHWYTIIYNMLYIIN